MGSFIADNGREMFVGGMVFRLGLMERNTMGNGLTEKQTAKVLS
jgi:hypothetical protein